MREYDCWFQKQDGEPCVKGGLPERILLAGGGEIFNNAVAEYSELLLRKWGVKTVKLNGFTGERCVVIGVLDEIRSKNLNFSLPASLPPEGFLIRSGDDGLLICGADERGALYGVYRFLALLASGAFSENFETTDSPRSKYRIINHWDEASGFIERGYAGRSLFFKDGEIKYDAARIKDYARLLASTGINIISINNVNVRGEAKRFITEEYLPGVAALSAIFRPFGVRLMLSINFAAPCVIGPLATADPLDEKVAAWWAERARVVYSCIPDLAGFLVKADSEGEPGPFQYGRTHADGANMLAAALKPYGGELIWRCFVYNNSQDWRNWKIDRARAACDVFLPLDGAFSDNVLLQIKYGPLDFQVLEPVTPLLGALKKTRRLIEFQITQEYTGQQIDLCFLPYMWEKVMNFDAAYAETGFKIKELAANGGFEGIEGFAAVANTGLDKNWTGHTLAQANLYGYGRIAWKPDLKALDIAEEWSRLTFGVKQPKTAETVSQILMRSYPAYEKYNAPFGICFMVTPSTHYGPNIEGYEYSKWGTYHRADLHAIGVDRTVRGSGYAALYAPKNAAVFSDPSLCPKEFLLFFHRLPYGRLLANGETLLQNIYDSHFEGVEEAQKMMEDWEALKEAVDGCVYESVLEKFKLQIKNAREWRDQINTYFFRKTGISDAKGRLIYP
ncbi:MAG: alpha-glucuronidase [Spirochaetaceae bacterium]|jgi:alpha-glucuronidase|nr:alpha-glucuronidase [Spirochaetaceae bacterium]